MEIRKEVRGRCLYWGETVRKSFPHAQREIKEGMKKELSHNISILPFLINFFIPVVCTRVKRDREGGKERKKKNSNKYSAIKENSRSKAILVEQFLERGILE